MVPAAASLRPFQLPRASEPPVTFHCIGRSSLPPFQLPRASESPVTFHRVHTPQALSSHTIRIREESYRFFTPLFKRKKSHWLFLLIIIHGRRLGAKFGRDGYNFSLTKFSNYP